MELIFNRCAIIILTKHWEAILMSKTKLFILFLIVFFLRSILSIFNITFISDIYNTIFNWIFTIGFLCILLQFRKDKSKSAIIVKYVTPIIIILIAITFYYGLIMLLPYIFYLILAGIMLPLYESSKDWKIWSRIFVLGFVGFHIAGFIFFFALLGNPYLIQNQELVFSNNDNRRLVVISISQGSLGGNTSVRFQQRIGNILKCERTVANRHWHYEFNLDEIYEELNQRNIWFCGINIR